MTGWGRVCVVLATYYESLSAMWHGIGGEALFAAVATTGAVAGWWVLMAIAHE